MAKTKITIENEKTTDLLTSIEKIQEAINTLFIGSNMLKSYLERGLYVDTDITSTVVSRISFEHLLDGKTKLDESLLSLSESMNNIISKIDE